MRQQREGKEEEGGYDGREITEPRVKARRRPSAAVPRRPRVGREDLRRSSLKGWWVVRTRMTLSQNPRLVGLRRWVADG